MDGDNKLNNDKWTKPNGSIGNSFTPVYYGSGGNFGTCNVDTDGSKFSEELDYWLATDDAVKVYVKASLEALSFQRLRGYNISWKDNSPAAYMSWFYFEGANTTTMDLPFAHCVVVVWRYLSTRGVAIAYAWTNSTKKNIWKNNLHNRHTNSLVSSWIGTVNANTSIGINIWSGVARTVTNYICAIRLDK